MENDEGFGSLLFFSALQTSIFEKREKSRIEKQYCDVMQRSAVALATFTRSASFDKLIRAEKMFQENDLVVYANSPATRKSVQEGIEDLEAGERVYRQLVENTAAYREHDYRRKEKVSPAKTIPIDTMRRALRGQV